MNYSGISLIRSPKGLEILVRSIKNSNYREVDIIYNPAKMTITCIIFLSYQTCQGEVSFTHTKHVFSYIVFEIQ